MVVDSAPAQQQPTKEEPGELQRRIQELEEENLKLAQQQRSLRERATVLEVQLRQVLTSTSWRITAPLRRLRTLIGAPPPLAEIATPLVSKGEAAADQVWDSVLPRSTSARMLLASAEQAAKTNHPCRLLGLEHSMQGLVSDALLTCAAPEDRGATLYFGRAANPPSIAFLGSDELATELAHDVRVAQLRQDGWREQLNVAPFAFLLLEPVWHVGNREWRNALAADGRQRDLVEELLSHCREKGLPTVLWFRGDAATAGHFNWLLDHVDAAYAMDEAAAVALQGGGRRPVEVLAPAIQPALHNPLRSWEHLAEADWRQRVLYDGWFDLQEGAAEEPLLKALQDEHLLVAESEWEFGGVRLDDMPSFKRNAIGCVDLLGKLAVSRMVGGEVFRRSPLIPDWRRRVMMLRSMACGSLVADLSGDEWRVGELPLREGPEELARRIPALLSDRLTRDRLVHSAFREVFSHHCLSDRLNRISADLGLPLHFGPPPASVACLLVTMRPQLLAGCLERFRADVYPHKELVVVLHGYEASLQEARALIMPGERISIYQLGREHSLGSCLNFAAAQTDAEYWAKVDDDDLYGPDYLSDVMLYRRAFDFPLAGKTAAFIYNEADQEVRWDPRYAAGRSLQLRRAGQGERIHIAGGTLVGKSSVLADVPFSVTRRRGSDTEFLRRADAAGLPFVSLDYFNFALFRSGAEGFHTWNADLEQMKQRTRSVALGPAARTAAFA